MTKKEAESNENPQIADSRFVIHKVYTQRIGMKEYQVQLGGTLLSPEGKQLMGRQSGDNQTIQLDSGWSPAGLVDTYIHESIHTISGYSGFTFSEEQVCTLSAFMVAFILDHGWSTLEKMQKTILEGGPNATDIRDVSSVRKSNSK